MQKSTRMTEREKGMIDAFKGEEKSNRWIANKLGRDESSIRYYLKNKEKKREKRGPKIKLSKSEKNLILRNSGNKMVSVSKLKYDLGLKVSGETIRSVLKNSPNIQFKKMLLKPPLDGPKKHVRLAWAKDKITWGSKWKDVIWSDEKKFNLDGPDGFAYYWHDLRKEELVFSKRHTGGGSLMIWACFNFHGKSELAFVSRNQDQWEYQGHLNDRLLPFLDHFGGQNPVFQQDNARCHIARSTIDWLKDKNLEIMEWPAYSPDLNPIENLWGVLARRVYAGGKQFSSIEYLKISVIRCWEEIEKNLLETLANSMPKRIYQVIYNHGGSKKY